MAPHSHRRSFYRARAAPSNQDLSTPLELLGSKKHILRSEMCFRACLARSGDSPRSFSLSVRVLGCVFRYASGGFVPLVVRNCADQYFGMNLTRGSILN